MALEEYLGSIVMEVDGREVEIESLDADNDTGRKLVKTMNKTGHAKGFARGIETFELKVSAVIPLAGDINWAGIEGAKITLYPLQNNGQRVSYLDCFTTKVGRKYKVDGEAMQDLEMSALRRVEE
jgi:hypothetical protein